MDAKKLTELIEKDQNELFELLSSLVKIESENKWTYGNEEEIARYIYNLCKKLDLETDIYSPMDIEGFSSHPEYWPGEGGKALENRYNVTARMRGETDIDELHLMAHSDTVEVGDLANWELPPFSGLIKDGKIHGRGAVDDKYAIATALFIIKKLKELGFKPKKNLLFTAYVDEEHGGSHGALAGVFKYPAPYIVSMDGKSDEIWNCGSGGGEAGVHFHTKETADSAYLTYLGTQIVMEEVEKFAHRRREELEENRFYKGTYVPSTALRYMDIHAGNEANDLGVGRVWFVYYTDKSKEEIDLEIKQMGEILTKRLSDIGIVYDGFKQYTRFFHYVSCEPDSYAISTLLDSAREVDATIPQVCGSCLSDLSAIAKYGSANAFGFGAGRKFDEEGGAHQPNEFITCDKLLEYAKIMANYVVKMIG